MYVFIVRPFGLKQGIDFEQIDRELLQPALRALGITGETTTAIAEAGNIREDMFAKLLTADLVIADISVHNANVFYELGIRHALRDKKTLLLRCSGENLGEVPFDLKTDRYLSYTLATLKTDALRLKRALQETLHSDRKDSPVFALLPDLQAQDPERFLAPPAGFVHEVAAAQLNAYQGKLALLAAETAGFPWELSGLRLVGETQFKINSLTGARLTWERIRALLPGDQSASDRLSTIYQQLAEEYASPNPESNAKSLGLLALSDQSINRLLEGQQLSAARRAEAYALKGRNARFRWVNDWQHAPATEYRQRALESTSLLQAYEAYAQAFQEDLNHYYSGINALGLLTITLDLAREQPPVWEEHFDSTPEAEVALERLERRYNELIVLVGAALESARHRRYSHGERDEWLEQTQADLRFLTLDKPRRILRLYQEVMHGANPRLALATRRQLELYHKLGIRGEILEPVIEQLLPAEEAALISRPYCIVFTGHMIDRPGRPARFPASGEARARAAIRERLLAIRQRVKGPIIGIAGGACGGDILFHEICQEPELNISTQLFLAIPKQAYINESVSYAGPDWVERFEVIYRTHHSAQDERLRVLSESKKMPFWLQRKKQYGIWERMNLGMIYYALTYGGEDVSLVALWDGRSGNGPGGTQDMVSRMTAHNVELSIIKTTELFGL